MEEKKMKKVFVLMLALMICLAFLAGCGSKEPAATDSQDTNAQAAQTEISGDVFDAGEVSALVPAGWKAFAVSNIFSEEENATDPTAMQICKDAKEEWDLFSKPYLQINYYGADTSMEIYKDWYDDTEDLEPIKLDNYTWNGFTGKSMDYPVAVLWAEDGDDQFQVTIMLEMDDGKISVDDADVKAILASIKPSV
jgi:predicted small lipoprotein YifL